MIPSLIKPLPWAMQQALPPGIHAATLRDVEATFATTPHRKWLFEGLLKAVDELKQAGCARIYLGGSYVTSQPHPGDYDGCWDPTGVTASKLHPCFFDMPASRQIQKLRHRGELWQGRHDLPPFDAMTRFFQQDTRQGCVKGLLEILLK